MEWTDEQNAGRAILEFEAYRGKVFWGRTNEWGYQPLDDVALDAIDAGLHSPNPSPNLAELAFSSYGQNDDLFDAVLRDYEITLPSAERDVALRFTLLCVRAVLDGRMAPEEGSDGIWEGLNPWDLDPLYADRSLSGLLPREPSKHRSLSQALCLFENLTDMLEQFPWPPFKAAETVEAADAIQPDHRAVKGGAEEHLLRVLEEVMDGAMGPTEGAARLRWVLRELPKPRCERLQGLIRKHRWRWRELIDIWT